MALDGIMLFGIALELEQKLLGGRVEKVHQPEKDEIHLLMRSQGENLRLLVSASANHARVHLTKIPKANPPAAPMFCMVLRKHLTGTRLSSIEQPGLERILRFTFDGFNELGDPAQKTLIVEIMGRHSNIIFVDQEGRILESAKHIPEAVSSVRQVLPGRVYHAPPAQDKFDPLTLEEADLLSIASQWESGANLARRTGDTFTGVSRQSAAELAYRGGFEPGDSWDAAARNRFAASFLWFFNQVRSGAFSPVLLVEGTQRPKDIFPFHYRQYDPSLLFPYPSFGEALDAFYFDRDKSDRIAQRTTHMAKVIKTNLERCEKKLALQTREIQEAEKADTYRLYGELLTANLYALPSGTKEVSVFNYYDPDGSNLIIPMDQQKTPGQNAQHYFKLYTKAKTALEKQKQLRQENMEEIKYLESLSDHLSRASEEAEIMEIRQELLNGGYMKGAVQKGRGKAKQPPASKPHRYLSSDNYEIYVGRNNLQNDELTLRFASGNDLWLHTKVIPGSHVIVKSQGGEFPPATILEAAKLAAYYSQARMSENVPVDYCPRRNVKKPGGAKPGMVIYDHYKTVYVTPSEAEVVKIIKTGP